MINKKLVFLIGFFMVLFLVGFVVAPEMCSVLGEVVCADFFTSIAGTDLGTPCLVTFIFGLLLIKSIETASKHTHCFCTVPVLRFLIHALDNQTGRQVDNSDGGAGFVDFLPSWSGGTKRVNSYVFWVNFNINIFYFR